MERFDTRRRCGVALAESRRAGREYLNWRYPDSPRDYVAYRAAGGYAVLGHKRHRGRSDRARRRPRRRPRGPLLRPASSGVRARDAALLFAIPAPGEDVPPTLSCGFVPTPRTLNFMGKPLAGDLDTDRAPGAFTLGDTDFF